MERISSRQNALVKRFRELHAGRVGDQALLDGAHLLEDALSAGVEIEVAAFSDRLAETSLAPLAARTASSGIRTIVVPPQVLSAMSPVRQPSGVAAIARVPGSAVEDVLRGSAPLVVILHEVQDPGNVGATIRTADACGATGVITTPGSADPFGWKALRASMGSTFRLPIAAKVSVAEVVATLRSRGIPLVATVPRGGTPLPEADLTGPAAILIGGEGAGVPPELAERSAIRLTIPMRPAVESLNVAVAASLILYEASRQRRIHAALSDVPVRRS